MNLGTWIYFSSFDYLKKYQSVVSVFFLENKAMYFKFIMSRSQ